jgi:hypothetical protein
VSLEGLLRSPRVQSEIEVFAEWVRRYGLFAYTYEQSKIVTRTAWLARVMLDEGYRMLPGREREVLDFVAQRLTQLVEELGIPRESITRGELHGTREDVLKVVTRVYPNVRQTERPSLAVLEKEGVSPRPAGSVRPPVATPQGRVKYLYALAATILLSMLIIALLSLL